MKKSTLRGVFIVALLFLLCGAVNAAPVEFTDTKNFENIWLFSNGTYTWQHDVTSDFSIPYDTVNSATLTISGYGIGGANDRVNVESTFQGYLTGDSSSVWRWYLDKSTTELNIGNIFSSSWSAGAPLDVSLNYVDWFGGFSLTQSVFTLTYENVTPTVPIPGTLLMLGTGLIGLLGIRRRFSAN